VFNVTTGLIALVFIRGFVEAVETGSAWLGIAADDWTLKLALFHTLFNLAGLALMLPLTGRLVSWLERVLPERRASVVTPRYLARPMLEMPDAGLEAVRKELQHLFANVFDIMALTLHADPVRLRRGEQLDALDRPPERVRALDIDDYYVRRVKPLYGDILDFLAGLQTHGAQVTRAYALRASAQQMIEALKDLKHMQKNLVRYLDANALHPRAEYVALRRDLARLLADIQRLADTPEVQAEAFDALGEQVAASDLVANGTIDTLMRERRIGPEQATSLMNDAGYAAHIASSLLAMARVIFVAGPVEHAPEHDRPLDGPVAATPEPQGGNTAAP
jgi:phosphate:Na+ symporter